MALAAFSNTCKVVVREPKRITVTAGAVRNDLNSATRTLSAATDIYIDATAGAAGALDTGSITASTWYAVFLIYGSSPGTSVILSASHAGPTLPATYTDWCFVDLVYVGADSQFAHGINHESAVGTPTQLARMLGKLWDRLASTVQGSGGAASETVSGVAELATQAEVNTGTDDARIVTPLKLATYVAAQVPAASETASGKAELATQTEVNTGTDDARIVTPLKLATYATGSIKGRWVLLDTQTPAGSATVTFSAISQSYDDLMIRYKASSGSAGPAVGGTIEFNSDTTAGNYHRQQVSGVNNAASVDEGASDSFIFVLAGATVVANEVAEGEITIPRYTGANRKKARSVCTLAGAADSLGLYNIMTGWASNAAITGIVLRDAGLITGTFELYGIKYT